VEVRHDAWAEKMRTPQDDFHQETGGRVVSRKEIDQTIHRVLASARA